MRRVAEQFRRIERRQVRTVRVVRALQSRPGGVDDEQRDADERQRRLDPPAVQPRRPAESNLRQTEIDVGHGREPLPPPRVRLAYRRSRVERYRAEAVRGTCATPAYCSRNCAERARNCTTFSLCASECPSLSATMYSTGTFRARSAATIRSDSLRGTRGSFAPAYTNSGATILSTSFTGEMESRNAASLSGSPNSSRKISWMSPLVVAMNVLRSATPNRSTPARHRSGMRVSPTRTV